MNVLRFVSPLRIIVRCCHFEGYNSGELKLAKILQKRFSSATIEVKDISGNFRISLYLILI